MRSSNLKHCKKGKFFSGSLLIPLVVAISMVVIPLGCLIPQANAVTEKQFRTLDIAVNELKIKNDKKNAKKVLEERLNSESEKNSSSEIKKKNNKKDKVADFSIKVAEKKEVTLTKTESKKASATVPAEVTETENKKSESNNSYCPQYVSLSAYDRAKLERLVEGEAGGLGYDGCLLVAQAIRDSMNLSCTNSIDKIISDYSYSGSTHKQPSKAAKKAVSYIFDKNGYAINHRVLYFYATDMVYSKWHETQNYITTCGNMRFFDKSV